MRKYIYKNKKWLRIVRVIDGIGEKLIRPLLSSPADPPAPTAIKKILIIKLDHLGDLLLSTPSLKLLRRAYPDAHISMVVGPWGEKLMKDCPFLDRVIVYRPGWMEQGKKKKVYWAETLDLIRLLRRERYDLFFELRGDLFSILIGFVAKIPYRIGFGVAGGGWLLTNEVTQDNEKHQIEIMLDIVTEVAPQNIDPDLNPELWLTDQERRWARQYLSNLGIDSNRWPLIGIHLGAGYPSKQWKVEKYARLIKRLTEELKAKILLVGGKEEEKYRASIQDDQDVYSAIGKCDIRQTAALLECCHLFVGNDSAPAHLAAAAGVAVVVVFCAANSSARWGPFGEKVIVINKESKVDCSGCEHSRCEDTRCMDLISVDEVFGAIKELLPGIEKLEKTNTDR